MIKVLAENSAITYLFDGRAVFGGDNLVAVKPVPNLLGRDWFCILRKVFRDVFRQRNLAAVKFDRFEKGFHIETYYKHLFIKVNYCL